jgi:hypothetical protein
MKKVLTLPGHKGNSNQNHTKIPPHSFLELLPSRAPTPTNVGKSMRKKEPSNTAGENVS